MREDIAGPQGASSRPTWECLEALVREKAQERVQRILEEQVTELLGREKSERKTVVDPAPGYRNGYGKAHRQPPRLAISVALALGRVHRTPGSSPELCVKVRGSSSMLRLGCLGDLLGLEE